MHPSRAFTRLELAVVVGLFAVVAALLVPVVVRRRDALRDGACRDNLRRHGEALADFVARTHEYPLEFQAIVTVPTHARTWVESLFGPTASRRVREDAGFAAAFACPSAIRPDTMPPGRVYADYGYNTQGIVTGKDQASLGLGRVEFEGLPVRPVKESEVAMPSEMVAFGDGVVGRGDNLEDGRAQVGLDGRVTGDRSARERVLGRHAGAVTLLFADGHGARVPIREAYAPDNAFRRLWSRDHQPHAER